MRSEPAAVQGYVIARLSAENLPALEDLYQAVYGQRPATGYFLKKYDTAYSGAVYLGFIAYNQDNIAIGYYGVMPCLIRYGDRLILGAQSGDTMTHPDFRNKGIFVELSKLTIELCRREDIRLLFGFPNQHSYHGFVTRLGWRQTETMDFFVIPIRTLPLAAVARRIRLLKGAYRRYCRFILDGRNDAGRKMPNSVIEDGYNGLWRSEAYMQYREYTDNHVIRIGAAKAWLKIDNDLIIGDLALADAGFDPTIAILKRMAAALGLRRILFHSSPGTRLHRLFASRYAGNPSFPVIFQDLDSGLPLETIKFTFADIDIF